MCYFSFYNFILLFRFHVTQCNMLRLSGSSHIFLLKLYNYISRFCCASSFVLSSCPAWQNIYGRKRASERRREAATSSEVSSCTSPIEHLYISQFPFVFRNVFVAAVRVTYFYLPLLLALPLGCRCSCCYYCCFSFCPSPFFLFVFRWPFSHATPNGAFGTFQRNSVPWFRCLLHNLNCLSAGRLGHPLLSCRVQHAGNLTLKQLQQQQLDSSVVLSVCVWLEIVTVSSFLTTSFACLLAANSEKGKLLR